MASPSFSKSSPPLFSKSKIYEALNEYNIEEHSVSTIVGASWDEKSTLANFIIRGLWHYKEARGSRSGWEHEFLMATIYRPDGLEVAGVLVIDRENRPTTPDIVRVIPSDTLRSNPLPRILSHLGYHPSSLGRYCIFASPHSVGEIASILAAKSQAGGKYSPRDKNCYWYANVVFSQCLDSYGGSIIKGPYFNYLGKFVDTEPHNIIANGIMNGVKYASAAATGAGLGIASAPLVACGISITIASIIITKTGVSQAAPSLK